MLPSTLRVAHVDLHTASICTAVVSSCSILAYICTAILALLLCLIPATLLATCAAVLYGRAFLSTTRPDADWYLCAVVGLSLQAVANTLAIVCIDSVYISSPWMATNAGANVYVIGWCLFAGSVVVTVPLAWTHHNWAYPFGLLLTVSCVVISTTLVHRTAGSLFASHAVLLVSCPGAIWGIACACYVHRRTAALPASTSLPEFCPDCHYPLHGLPANSRCPECGGDIPAPPTST